jgi:hypothetical protein
VCVCVCVCVRSKASNGFLTYQGRLRQSWRSMPNGTRRWWSLPRRNVSSIEQEEEGRRLPRRNPKAAAGEENPKKNARREEEERIFERERMEEKQYNIDTYVNSVTLHVV